MLGDIGVPAHYHRDPQLWLSWTAAVLKKALALVARFNDITADAALGLVLSKTQACRDDFAALASRMESERAAQYEEEAMMFTPILELSALDKIVRYESHLNRQLIQTLDLIGRFQVGRCEQQKS